MCWVFVLTEFTAVFHTFSTSQTPYKMSAFPDSKPVWISPAMIGQKRKSADELAALQMSERPRLNPRAASFSAATEPPAAEQHAVDASTTTEDIAMGDGVASRIMSPYDTPVMPVGAEALNTPSIYAPNFETLEALAAQDPDFAEHLSMVSKDWPSPGTEESGLYAKIWVSPLIAEYERWQVVKHNLKSMELIPRSPVVPTTFSEWLIHRAEMTEINAKDLGRKLANTKAEVELGQFRERVSAAFGGKAFNDGRSGVTSRETVWAPWSRPTMKRPQASWPCYQEMKEEGDERNTSGFGRFPALPRIAANETVNYKHRNVIDATDLDRVWPLPPVSPPPVENEEGILIGPNGEGAEALLDTDLLAALDE